MRQLSTLLHGLASSLSVGSCKAGAIKSGSSDGGQAAADDLAQHVRKGRAEAVLRSGGVLLADGDAGAVVAAACSRRGEKGVNQDCLVVWENFGRQDDVIFGGIFDGHGPWGHYVAKAVRDALPPVLLRHCLALASATMDDKLSSLDAWHQSFIAACAAVDRDLQHLRSLDAFHSGTTALSVVKQVDLLVIANVGDSRAVLATASGDGGLTAVQLTVDFKPNVPQEAERIARCNGRVYCMSDEPGVHRVWLPDKEEPGLAMSRAFGDFCLKEHGLISVPDVAHRRITADDQFIILATDGVWDVVSNDEAVQVVASAAERGKSAKALVEHAARAWRRKRKWLAADDCSVVCLFFHHPPP